MSRLVISTAMTVDGVRSPLTGEWADLLNPMPKFVASGTLQGPLDWNATLIEGDLARGVARLKEELDGDLLLIGCGELARYLVERGLIDELRFWVHPALWGQASGRFSGTRRSGCSSAGRRHSTRESSFCVTSRLQQHDQASDSFVALRPGRRS